MTGLIADGLETVALSSTARSPVRVTVEVPRDELDDLAALLTRAQELIETLRQGLGLVPGLASRSPVKAFDYAVAGARVAERALAQRPRLGHEERLVFVVGCPRSGRRSSGRSIGGLPGFIDLSEVTPWKAALPHDRRRQSCARSSSGCG